MLDMGFLPDIRRVLQHILPPAKRQTLFFSATMPPPIAELSREMLQDPATINIERRSAPAVGITQAVYPVPQQLKPALLLHAARRRRDARRAGVHPHQAPRQPAGEVSRRAQASRSSAFTATDRSRSGPRRWPGSRAASTGCWSRPTSPRAASTSPRSATSSTSTCRASPEDYIHRVGRTARAETTGSAFTLVSPEEEGDLRGIERAIGNAAAARDAAGFRLQRAPAAEPRSAAAASAARSAQPSARTRLRVRSARSGPPAGPGPAVRNAPPRRAAAAPLVRRASPPRP